MEDQKRMDSSIQKCQNCGATLRFNPNTQTLYCDSCNTSVEFERVKEDIKHEYGSEVLDKSSEVWKNENKVVKCQTCGAQVVVNGLEYSQICPYCGSNYVADADELPGLLPDVIIPFAFDENEAAKKFVVGVKKKFFVPRSFKKQMPDKLIHSIYIPTFSFDCDTYSAYDGTLEKVTVTTDSKGKTHTHRKVYHISGHMDLEHRDVLVESSSKINESQLQSLLPYNMEETFKYDPNFLRGYCVEHYTDAIEECHKIAKDEYDDKIKRNILMQYDYTNVLSLRINTDYQNQTYSYAILPLYNFEFLYKKKKYFALMNGQTGKIGSGLPISVLKIVSLVVIALIILAAVLYFAYFRAYFGS